MPLVAIGREVGVFLRERIGLESWQDAALPIPVVLEKREEPERDEGPERSGPNAA